MMIDNATQIEFWNGETGHNWVTHDALMEAMLQPLGESVMDTLAPQTGEHVLDIGCGCGHTSLSLAKRVGAEGSVTGVDISTPMLANISVDQHYTRTLRGVHNVRNDRSSTFIANIGHNIVATALKTGFDAPARARCGFLITSARLVRYHREHMKTCTMRSKTAVFPCRLLGALGVMV